MLLFYGLGNNEPKYLKTKHNAGRLVLESLSAKMDLGFEKQSSYFWSKALIPGELGNDRGIIYFLYSAGFMNTSGKSLVDFINYFKIQIKDLDLIIFQDDSDQLEGKIRFLPGGGTAGHKGIEDIYRHLPGLGISLEKVWRLKIGIRPPENRLKSETFVLSSIFPSEQVFYDTLASKFYEGLSLLQSKNFTKFQSFLYL